MEESHTVTKTQTVFFSSGNRTTGSITNAYYDFSDSLLECDEGEVMRFALHKFSIFNTAQDYAYTAVIDATNSQILFLDTVASPSYSVTINIPHATYTKADLAQYVETQFNATVKPTNPNVTLRITYIDTANKFSFAYYGTSSCSIGFANTVFATAAALWGFSASRFIPILTTQILQSPTAFYQSDLASLPQSDKIVLYKDVYIRMFGTTSTDTPNIEGLTLNAPLQAGNILACIPLGKRFEVTNWRMNSTYEYYVWIKDRQVTQLRFQLVDASGKEMQGIFNHDYTMVLRVDTVQEKI